MHIGEIFLLLGGSLAVTAFARWRGWPAPLLVMGVAFIVSVLPFVPEIDVDGELVLAVVLPPLLYSSALEVTYLDFRRSFGQIRRLGVGLPIATAVVVGLVVSAHRAFPRVGRRRCSSARSWRRPTRCPRRRSVDDSGSPAG